MTIREGVCDYCGRERLLETGDECSKIQFGKLWCGTCREGSRQRYTRFDNDWLEGQIDVVSELLDQHPIERGEHIRMRLFKLDNQDEMWRMTRELEFRRQDELPSKA